MISSDLFQSIILFTVLPGQIMFKFLSMFIKKILNFYLKKTKIQQLPCIMLSRNFIFLFRMEDYSIVRFILERLPKNPTLILDAQDSYGNTPTHLAFLNSNLDIIRELVQRKAKLEIRNNDEMTPTDYGLTSEDPSIKRYLMDL